MCPLFLAAAITESIQGQLKESGGGHLVAAPGLMDLIGNTAIELVRELEVLPCHVPEHE